MNGTITRSDVFSGAAVASAVLFGLAGTATAAVDGPKVNWNVAAYGQPRAATIAIDRMAEYVGAETKGNFAVKIHYGSTLAPEKEALDGIKIGAYEIGWAVAGYAPGKQPALNALGLPFLPLGDMKQGTRISHAFYQHPAVKRDFDAWNGIYHLPIFVPAYEFMGRGRAPEKLEDWKGLRVRALGGAGTAMAKIGSVPTNVTAPESYGAMERGVLDAVSFAYYAFVSFKINEVGSWYTKGLNIATANSSLVMSKDAYAKLPPQYQKAIFDVVPRALQDQIEAMDEAESKAEADFKRRGIKTVVIAPELREEMVRLGGRPVWDEWIAEITAKGYPGRELIEFILSEAKKASS
jgi:TRAP-type C4-dicarboxylate transport system substrate-binding protein